MGIATPALSIAQTDRKEIRKAGAMGGRNWWVFSALALALLLATGSAASAQSTGSELTIRARGQTGDEIIQVRIGLEVISEFSVSTSWNEITVDVDESTSLDEISVGFVNNTHIGDSDNNAFVDWVELDGDRRQGESGDVWSTGKFTPGTGCTSGPSESEALYCAGFLHFGGTPDGPTVRVHGIGSTGTENIELQVDGIAIATGQVAVVGNPFASGAATGSTEFTLPDDLDHGRIRIAFVNDGFYEGVDRNVRIDQIEVDGVTYPTADPLIESEGSWGNGSQCDRGFFETEVLACDGWFQIPGAPASGTPEASETGPNQPEPADAEPTQLEPSEAAPTAPANPSGSITVVARGATGTEQLHIDIDGVEVHSWNPQTADSATRYTHPTPVTASQVRVRFSNDGFDQGRDRNAWIDNISIGDERFESEHPSVQSLGAWGNGGTCQAGAFGVEFLACNGWFQYSDAGASTVAPVNGSPTPVEIRALGTSGEEQIELRIQDAIVARFELSAGWDNYTHSVEPNQLISDIKVAFVNDQTGRDVRVDFIRVGGTTYQTEDPNVLSTGSWTPGTNCAAGNKQVEWLHCNGYFQFEIEQLSASTDSVPTESDFTFRPLATGLEQPIAMEVDPEGHIFVIGRCGRFYVWSPETGSIQQTSSVDVRCDFELGLIGIALDPDFESNRQVYLQYNPSDFNVQRVSRFEIDTSNRLIPNSEVVLLEFDVQTDECCHQAGDLEFGPQGDLYISTGDNVNPFAADGFAPIDERPGRSAWDAQRTSANTNDLNGKILRITPNPDGTYSIPDGNLFEGDDLHREEIFIMGNRNPFRMSVDQETGWLYWGDIGPDADAPSSTRGPTAYDEINRAQEPGNYGWPYSAGFNEPYFDFNFGTGQSGPLFDLQTPTNDSPNNTGATSLPPSTGAWLRFPHQAMMAGPVYHFDEQSEVATRLPDYFDNKLLFWNFNNGEVFTVDTDENLDNPTASVFFQTLTEGQSLIDMTLDGDDHLLVLGFDRNFNGELHRIEFGSSGTPTVPAEPTTPEPDVPSLEISTPAPGSFFEYGDVIEWTVAATDAVDGSTSGGIDCAEINVELLLAHVTGTTEHDHGIDSATGCSGSFVTTLDAGHSQADVYLKVLASYTNSEGVTGQQVISLQPRFREAEHWTAQSGVIAEATTDIGGGNSAAFINHGDWTSYRDINLGGVDHILVRVASDTQGGTIEARIGDPNGPIVGTVDIDNTGGWQTWETLELQLSSDAGGHGEVELYLVFTGGDGFLFNVNWLQFTTTTAPPPIVDCESNPWDNCSDGPVNNPNASRNLDRIPRSAYIDSYSVAGRCYIDTTFDHGIGDIRVDTPVGERTIREVADAIGPGPGRGDNPVYNDIQCGNGPANDAGDEDFDQCPGRVDIGRGGCNDIGPTWRLDLVYGRR